MLMYTDVFFLGGFVHRYRTFTLFYSNFSASLTLDGGFGWLSGQHGLVIDNVVQMTIVTASGEILTISDSENADIFWALRGGGSNFGVVTQFVYKLHEQRPDVYSSSTYQLCRHLGHTSDWFHRACLSAIESRDGDTRAQYMAGATYRSRKCHLCICGGHYRTGTSILRYELQKL
jgi:hypothetical protein